MIDLGFQLLYQMDGLNGLLRDLIQKGLQAKRFLSALTKKLVKKSTKNPHSKAVSFLGQLLVDVPMDGEQVIEVVQSIFAQPEDMSLVHMDSVIGNVDKRYPLQFDQAINGFLKREMDAEKKARALSLVYGTPNATIHSPMEGSEVTLLAAADDSDVATRRAVHSHRMQHKT